jgi:hypothetical protein
VAAFHTAVSLDRELVGVDQVVGITVAVVKLINVVEGHHKVVAWVKKEALHRVAIHTMIVSSKVHHKEEGFVAMASLRQEVSLFRDSIKIKLFITFMVVDLQKEAKSWPEVAMNARLVDVEKDILVMLKYPKTMEHYYVMVVELCLIEIKEARKTLQIRFEAIHLTKVLVSAKD